MNKTHSVMAQKQTLETMSDFNGILTRADMIEAAEHER